jgi:hypothetical protein
MIENDPLDSLLREWQPPAPPASLDATMLAAYRTSSRPGLWQRFLHARVSIPVPVLAVLALITIALLLTFRTGEPQPPLPRIPGYVTRIEAAGFEPLPDGAARVVRRPEIRQ